MERLRLDELYDDEVDPPPPIDPSLGITQTTSSSEALAPPCSSTPDPTAWEKLDRVGRCRYDSPTRSKDWRWEKARLITETDGIFSRTLDDAAIYYAVRRLQSTHPDYDPSRLRQVVIQELLGDALPRLGEIEAFLISGETLARTASRYDVPECNLVCYAALFFDVLNEPIDSGWIRQHAIGGSRMYPSPSIEDKDTIMKVFAQGKGPHMLEAVIWCFRTPPPEVPKRLVDVPFETLLEIERWMLIRLNILMLTYQPSTPSEQLRFQKFCDGID